MKEKKSVSVAPTVESSDSTAEKVSETTGDAITDEKKADTSSDVAQEQSSSASESKKMIQPSSPAPAPASAPSSSKDDDNDEDTEETVTSPDLPSVVSATQDPDLSSSVDDAVASRRHRVSHSFIH